MFRKNNVCEYHKVVWCVVLLRAHHKTLWCCMCVPFLPAYFGLFLFTELPLLFGYPEGLGSSWPGPNPSVAADPSILLSHPPPPRFSCASCYRLLAAPSRSPTYGRRLMPSLVGLGPLRLVTRTSPAPSSIIFTNTAGGAPLRRKTL